ncbi:MAG TPA: YceI family protein [Solirubrobacteraceae bacterium]|jgi:polyisoprenoid-binding protein YceI|nr:YceI family protein [Solirubrobacteraceae bacterium]
MSTESPAAAPTGAISVPAGTWKVDPVHSSVEFQVKHLGIATVKGQFKEFEGTVEVGPDGAVAYGTVKTASVDTREPQRDNHLRSADFFEVDKYPEIAFRSTSVTPTGEDEFEIAGDLSMHGITRPITLEATLEGYEPEDHQGHTRVGLSATAQINRSDWEMRFNAALGSGNMVVSDKVKILVDVSAVKAD